MTCEQYGVAEGLLFGDSFFLSFFLSCEIREKKKGQHRKRDGFLCCASVLCVQKKTRSSRPCNACPWKNIERAKRRTK